MTLIQWRRVIVAAIMAELGVIAVLTAAIGVYMLLGPTVGARDDSLGEEIGYYVAPPAAAVMTVLAVLWAARKLTSGFVTHGVLIGVVGVLLTFWFIFGATPENRVVYVVSFALRIVGGFTGGILAQRRFTLRMAG